MPASIEGVTRGNRCFSAISTDGLETLSTELHNEGNGCVLSTVARLSRRGRRPQQPIWFARNQRTIKPPGTPSIHAMKYFMRWGVAS